MDISCEFKEFLDLLTLQNNSQDSELKHTQVLNNSAVKQIREQLEDLNNQDLSYRGDSYASFRIKETTKKVFKSYSFNDKSSISIDKSTVKLSVNPNTGQREYKLSCKRKKIISSIYSTKSEIVGPIHSFNKGKDKYYQVHTVKSSKSSYTVDKYYYSYRKANEDLLISTPCKYNMDRRSRSSRRDTVPIADSYYPFNEDYNNCTPCCAGAIPRLKPDRSSIRIRGTFDVGNNDLYLFKCSAAAAKDNEEYKNDEQRLEDQECHCRIDASAQPTRRSQGIQVSVMQSSFKSQPVQCDCKSLTDLQEKYENIKPNTLKVCESPLVIVSVYPNYTEKNQRQYLESTENTLNGECFGKKNFNDYSSSLPKKKSNSSSPRRKKQSRSSSPSKRSKDNLTRSAKNKAGKEVYSNSPKTGKSGPSKSSPRVKKNMVDSSTKKSKNTKGAKAGSSKPNTGLLQKKQEYSQSATPSSRPDVRSGSRTPVQTLRRSMSTSRESSKSRKSGSSLNNPYSFTKRDPCFRSVSMMSKDSASAQSTNEPLKAFLAQRRLNLERENENQYKKMNDTYSLSASPKNKNKPSSQGKVANYKTESPKRNQILSNQPPTPIQGGCSLKQYNQAYTCNAAPVSNQPTSRRLSSPQNRKKSNQTNQDYVANKDPNQNSKVFINIEGKNEKYDVSLHQDDVMILKQAKDRNSQIKRKPCRSGCPGTCNKQAQNTTSMTTDGKKPQSFSSSVGQYNPGLSLVSEKNNEKSLKKDNLQVAHRQRRTINNEKSCPKKKTKRDKKNNDLTSDRHYRGDDCITAEVFDRDREIRMLLGVNAIRDSKSENFKERVAEFLNLSSVDCIYKNCYLINKSNSSCSIAQSNILMRGDYIGNVVLNYENGLFRRSAMNHDLTMKNMYSDTVMCIKEHPCRNFYIEYKASMQFERNEKNSLTKISLYKDLVTDNFCAVPSILSCSLNIQRNSHQSENLIEGKKSSTVNEQSFHDINSHITSKEKYDIFEECCDTLNNFEDSFWINKINDILINELAIYQDTAEHPIDVKRPNEAFIQQLLFTTNKILKSRLSNLDPLTTDSNNVQFIYLGDTKSFTPNIGSSVLTVNSQFDNEVEDSGHKTPAKKIKKKFLKTIFSYLKKNLTNSRDALKGKTIEDSLDSYHINSILGAMEMTSSIALYSDLGINPSQKKSKRSFLGSARGFVTNWMRTVHCHL